MTHYTYPIGKNITTYPAHQGNQITREYYNFLVGEINAGTILKAVCAITDTRFCNKMGDGGVTSYYLISDF